jgi:hypothetical protein
MNFEYRIVKNGPVLAEKTRFEIIFWGIQKSKKVKSTKTVESLLLGGCTGRP